MKDDVESDEDETVIKSRRRDIGDNKKFKSVASDDEDELDKMERERQEDLKSRDEFAQRLKQKDKEKTRNIATKTGNQL